MKKSKTRQKECKSKEVYSQKIKKITEKRRKQARQRWKAQRTE